MVFEWILLGVGVAMAVVFIWWALVVIFGAWPVASRRSILDRAFAASRDIVKRDGRFCDLGSHNGTAMLALLHHFGGRVEGCEISLPYYLWSLLRIWNCGEGERARVRFCNLFEADLNRYDCIYLYFRPAVLKKVVKKFRELGEGKMVISCAFPIDFDNEDGEVDSGEKADDELGTKVYFYRKEGDRLKLVRVC